MRTFVHTSGSFLLFIIISFLVACKKFVEIQPAPDLINSEAVFTTDETATAAMSGVYAQMRQLSNTIPNGGISLFTGLSGDEIYNTSSSAVYDPFYKDSIPPANGTIERNFWADAYSNIYRTNAIIEGVNKSTDLSELVKKQLLGEAKFVRSFYYFYLANLFGDVPLVISTDYKVNEKMPRTPSSAIYLQMISDLLEAETLLVEQYLGTDKARPDKWAATALLARIYLFQENWVQAEAKASEVINAGMYSLPTDITGVFLKESEETIWQIAPRNGVGSTVEAMNYIPAFSSLRPNFALTDSLLSSFEAGDRRKVDWVKSNVVNTNTFSYPFKYKNRNSVPVTEYTVALRLAEMFLIRAEARAHLGNIAGGQEDISMIRNRAGLPDVTATSQVALLSAIEQERRVELFSEWGHRWLDLKRTGKMDAVLKNVKPTWQSFAALYPIPFSQIQLNPFLTQNPGY